MTTPPRPTRAEQRGARKAEIAAAAAREERRRRIRVAAVVAVALAVLGGVAGLALSGGGGPTADASGAAYRADKEAFRLPGLLDGATVSLADHAGTPVVVNFFASWCVYCNEELPGFVQVAAASAGRVDFIGVDTSDPGDGAAMARRFDLAGAGFALAKDVGADPASDLWASFGSQGLPVTAFYDASGKLVDFSGGMLAQDALEQRLSDDFGVEVTATSAADLPAPVIPLIPQGAYEIMRSNPGHVTFVVLDVRTAEEFTRGHLPDAVNLPLSGSGFADAVAALDPTASYVVYDGAGRRSATAARTVHDAGARHVYEIQGGYAAWTQQGLPTTS